MAKSISATLIFRPYVAVGLILKALHTSFYKSPRSGWHFILIYSPNHSLWVTTVFLSSLLESFFYIKGFEISVRDVNLVSKCLFSRSGHTTIQDGLLNKSRDLFSKAFCIVVYPLRENEHFETKFTSLTEISKSLI